MVKIIGNYAPKEKKARIDNPEDFDDFSKVAIVSKEEVKYYKRVSKQNRVYTSEDIINLKLGSYVVLKGYPFEGIGATILEVNLNLKLVKVALYPDSANIIVQIPMDNVFYSIYNDFDENKLMASNDFIQENIDSEKVEQFLLKININSMEPYMEKAWDCLTEQEQNSLFLNLSNGLSARETGEILKVSHYKYLEIKARAEKLFKLFSDFLKYTQV